MNRHNNEVRVTHLPTGIAATCNELRGQYRNRQAAMQLLRGKLWALTNAPAVPGIVASYALPDDHAWPVDLYDYNEDVSVISEYASRLGIEMAAKLDDAIRSALNEFLGRSDWVPDDLRGRLVSAVMPDKHTIYSCDGAPFLRVGPLEFPPIGDGLVHMLTASRTIERYAVAVPGEVSP